MVLKAAAISLHRFAAGDATLTSEAAAYRMPHATATSAFTKPPLRAGFTPSANALYCRDERHAYALLLTVDLLIDILPALQPPCQPPSLQRRVTFEVRIACAGVYRPSLSFADHAHGSWALMAFIWFRLAFVDIHVATDALPTLPEKYVITPRLCYSSIGLHFSVLNFELLTVISLDVSLAIYLCDYRFHFIPLLLRSSLQIVGQYLMAHHGIEYGTYRYHIDFMHRRVVALSPARTICGDISIEISSAKRDFLHTRLLITDTSPPKARQGSYVILHAPDISKSIMKGSAGSVSHYGDSSFSCQIAGGN
jgi:hypothetical protein